jgi:hypothetical protein
MLDCLPLLCLFWLGFVMQFLHANVCSFASFYANFTISEKTLFCSMQDHNFIFSFKEDLHQRTYIYTGQLKLQVMCSEIIHNSSVRMDIYLSEGGP